MVDKKKPISQKNKTAVKKDSSLKSKTASKKKPISQKNKTAVKKDSSLKSKTASKKKPIPLEKRKRQENRQRR